MTDTQLILYYVDLEYRKTQLPEGARVRDVARAINKSASWVHDRLHLMVKNQLVEVSRHGNHKVVRLLPKGTWELDKVEG